MIMLGDPRFIPLYIDNLVVYNYSSLVEEIPRLNLMPPQFTCNTEYEFDMMYANWLLNDQTAFHDLMLIMYAVYEGHDVYLCASNIDMVQPLNESFIKFIQQRYGINCYIINTVEDMECVRDFGSGFSIEGIGNFDIDKERLAVTAIVTQNNDKNDHSYDFVSKQHYTEDTEYGPV